MQFYLVTPVFLAVMAVCAMGGMRALLMLVAASMPFGMLAVIGLPAVGGLSLLAVNVAAAVLVAGGVLTLATRLVARQPVRIEPAALALLFFAAYSVFSATILVRLFAGDTMVFALSRGATGVRVSALFAWEKVRLEPSSSNISQTFYILIACGLFITACHVLTRAGATFGARCMALAASINLILGLIDLAAFDALLEPVRTASYSLSNEATVRGIPRIIGGYSEAASFGATSAMFFGWFASAFAQSGRPRDGILALGNGIFAALALSATGIIALVVVVCAILPRLLFRIPARIGRGRLIAVAMLVACGAAAIGGALVLTAAPEVVTSIVNDLILDKSESASGLERAAWAMGGLEAFRNTWGLGVGTGSLRSNGLVFVILGSVGIIGTAAFAAFIVLAFSGRAAPGYSEILTNARVAAVAVGVSLLLAATVPDPSVPLIFLAAIAVSARRGQQVSKQIGATHLPDDQVRSETLAIS